jgi:hypothetical protein
MDITAVINKKRTPKNFYFAEFSVNPDRFDTEEELVKYIYEASGTGRYYINFIFKGRKGATSAKWKGEINEVGSKSTGIISYRNFLEKKLLEKQFEIAQREPHTRHEISKI